MPRATFGSSVVTESATLTSPLAAIGARMSMSRCTSADFVTIPTGWLNLASTSSTCRMILSFFSIGW